MIITLPLAVPITKTGKLFWVNLNQYRNAHYQTLNKAKIRFKEEIESQVLALPYMQQIAITFTYHPGKGTIADTSNVCSIEDKFFCDALVDLKRIKDDSRKHILGTQYLPGDPDVNNPRVEAKIHLHK